MSDIVLVRAQPQKINRDAAQLREANAEPENVRKQLSADRRRQSFKLWCLDDRRPRCFPVVAANIERY